MRAIYVLPLGFAALLVSGCAGLEPMPVDSSYSVIDNRDVCNCTYHSRDGVLFKVYRKGRLFGGRTVKVEILSSDAMETVTTLTTDEQIERYLAFSPGSLDEEDETVEVNFFGGETHKLDLNLDKFPDLFEVGFVIGKLKVLDAMQNEEYMFVALQKPGNIIVLRFDKATRKAEEVVLHIRYAHLNLVGQILSIMSMDEDTTVHRASFIRDFHSDGNFFFGYTQKVLKPGSVVDLINAHLTLHDRSGEAIGALSDEKPKLPYDELDVYGDSLVLLARPLALNTNYDWFEARAFNKSTLVPVEVENVEHMVATTPEGAVYWDLATQDYFFRSLR